MSHVVFDAVEVGPWVCSRLGGDWREGDAAIGLAGEDGALIAGVVYDNYLVRSICAHVVIEGPITREFLRAVFAYPFEQLGVLKIIGPVDALNAAARRFDLHLGFTAEAVIADGGRESDLILYTMTRQQCRFLKD